MHSASGRMVISFNGEIYNYRALRADLERAGRQFRSPSDTEVLLEAIECWGMEDGAAACARMFAFALWDREERSLYLARDRFGEKPLHFGQFGGYLLFGSELKALRVHSAWNARLNRDALALMLRHYYIPAPHSIYERIRKVPPARSYAFTCAGKRLRWKRNPTGRATHRTGERANAPRERCGDRRAPECRARRGSRSANGCGRAGRGVPIRRDRFLADRSLMQQASRDPVRTFSIGFAEQEFNEAPFARRIASHLGTEHTELMISAARCARGHSEARGHL